MLDLSFNPAPVLNGEGNVFPAKAVLAIKPAGTTPWR
jgi:hypothetical protein